MCTDYVGTVYIKIWKMIISSVHGCYTIILELFNIFIYIDWRIVMTNKEAWDYAIGMIKVDGLELTEDFKKYIEKEK